MENKNYELRNSEILYLLQFLSYVTRKYKIKIKNNKIKYKNPSYVTQTSYKISDRTNAFITELE